MSWGTPVEVERKNRIKVAVAAWAYEVRNESIMSDHDFDDLCKKIDPSIDTGDKIMDKFFREEFSAHTGQWIWKYPKKKLAGLYNIYEKQFGRKS